MMKGGNQLNLMINKFKGKLGNHENINYTRNAKTLNVKK